MKILIIGGGYVGLATAMMFKEHHVFLFDQYEMNTELYNSRSDFTFELVDSFNIDVDVVFICLPTPLLNDSLDTSLVEKYISLLKNKKIVVRSTVPIGFCDEHCVDYMPEFLTEKEPFKQTRQVYGGQPNFQVDGLICTSTEAEIIKLSSNAYLSMRLAYFYEIKRISEKYSCDFTTVKDGICSDERIGFQYANAPFLIQGKCLPKDLKEFAKYSDLFFTVNKIKEMQTAEVDKYLIH